MAITDALLPEFDHEMGTTRRLLARVPEAELGWKPHERSMSLGRLASHLAEIPRWGATILESSFYDLVTGNPEAVRNDPTSLEELLETYDANIAAVRRTLVSKSDGELMAPWSLRRNGQDVFTVPRIAALRSFMLNHSIHHRGQLSVYLRMWNIPLPPIYGPSADEPLQ